MRYEVENSGLAPEDLAAVGTFEEAGGPTGERGIGADLLVAIAGDVAGGGITAALAGIWFAWRRRRERDLRDASAATVRVEVGFEDGGRFETVVELRGNGVEGVRRFELETGKAADGKEVRHVRVTFPEGQ
ncbi:hypothetical protein Misp01_08830 [Microtetraspora sp. NBRC 13810]|uniref:hypothetical protein n=1 Tax=Microtetraspora sp. NBRC 13810 TaxID=3030990 RepID=UPI0024A1D61B|nr:hypothetical protein [Microtetraspora sp. NBRC 13810]GLW05753.1 hypothetical protein Misp01_08830 [Microtetraspora sp. NBRC 13810]